MKNDCAVRVYGKLSTALHFTDVKILQRGGIWKTASVAAIYIKALQE